MSTFRYPIEIGDPGGQRFERIEALVDTGSTFTVVSGSLLRQLGVQPKRRIRLRLADNRVIERDAGETQVRLSGVTVGVTVVFGEDGHPALIGAQTLETALLAVDPPRERLVPTEGLLMAICHEGPLGLAARTSRRPAVSSGRPVEQARRDCLLACTDGERAKLKLSLLGLRQVSSVKFSQTPHPGLPPATGEGKFPPSPPSTGESRRGGQTCRELRCVD